MAIYDIFYEKMELLDFFEEMEQIVFELLHKLQSNFTFLNFLNMLLKINLNLFHFIFGTIIRNLISGSVAGVIAYSIVYPIDLTKTMISINFVPKELPLI